MENIAIFVDVQNIYYTTRDALGRHFDYNAFWRKAAQGHNVMQANAYAIASNNEKQRQFHHILRGIGFQVKLKPFTQRSDGSAKGDWDVGIAIDIIETAMRDDIDRIILLSGDGDFDILARRTIDKYGKFFDVYGVESLTAGSLIESVTCFHPINEELCITPR